MYFHLESKMSSKKVCRLRVCGPGVCGVVCMDCPLGEQASKHSQHGGGSPLLCFLQVRHSHAPIKYLCLDFSPLDCSLTPCGHFEPWKVTNDWGYRVEWKTTPFCHISSCFNRKDKIFESINEMGHLRGEMRLKGYLQKRTKGISWFFAAQFLPRGKERHCWQCGFSQNYDLQPVAPQLFLF